MLSLEPFEAFAKLAKNLLRILLGADAALLGAASLAWELVA